VLEPLIIAIDGPAGSGKSTLGRALAARLGLSTLDTGATYRAVAALAIREGIELGDLGAVAKLAASARLEIGDRVSIDGCDVTEEIRSEQVNASVSIVAANPEVRSALVAWQRRWAHEHHGGIVEGRDIGSVVFPDATVKLYLTANASERARRRAEEGQESIERRDRMDSTRAASPLTTAPDAKVIDTTALAVDEIVAMVIELVDGATGGDR
jgi:cytidylate kinase